MQIFPCGKPGFLGKSERPVTHVISGRKHLTYSTRHQYDSIFSGELLLWQIINILNSAAGNSQGQFPAEVSAESGVEN
jgi:hypothetical protein